MYTAFYHLSEEPFRLTSDPKFFHPAEPHAVALATVVEAMVRRKGFVVISGEIGTGKTTVLHTALRVLTDRATANNAIASAFILNPMVSREEFLEMIIEEFEIPCASTSKPARLAALHSMLLDMQRKGGTSVLLVDEAHLLSPQLMEEIRLLSNVDTYQEKLLQIVLSGQPELLSLLDQPEMRALRQRVACSCVLRPLSLSETRAYVDERLRSAGLRSAASLFPEEVLEGIFRRSQGVPRLINLLCDACLAIGYRSQRLTIQNDIVEQAANELGITRTATITGIPKMVLPPAAVATWIGSDYGAQERAATIETAVVSAVDVLIRAMRKKRASASE